MLKGLNSITISKEGLFAIVNEKFQLSSSRHSDRTPKVIDVKPNGDGATFTIEFGDKLPDDPKPRKFAEPICRGADEDDEED